MAFTSDDVAALKRAMSKAGNAAEVEYSDGTRTRFLAPKQAAELLAMMEADVTKGSGRRRKRQIRVLTSSGF
ncbi:hypothetical protein GBZ48_35550 [Azospirillum melinis]|uniref:Phage tail protein n=1 Tax=Azospirillum melinis TaxID=328839 RepID=A0ABX2KUN1_9PROT|nr:hypothetical protein [Azospirillum melinis]MBP2310507.1 hypothetical protein [Azospirillum melinis]NUB04510.1 hypothetical protein [Azospirillum melinis]